MATETQPELTQADINQIAAALDYEAAGMDAPEGKVEKESEATADQADQKAPEVTQEPGQEPAKEEPKDKGLSEPETQAEIDYKAEYERLKKESDRKEKSWQKLNEEKEALAKLKATTRADETRIAGDQFSAEEYEQYAEKLVDEGNGPDARKAMTRAKMIRQEALREKWNSSMKEAMDENPELHDMESDLSKAVQGVLKDQTWGSFKAAVRLAKAESKTGSIPGLQGKLEQAEKEIQRLNKAMEIGGKAGVPKHDGPKAFKDMSMDEMREHIRERAAEADDAYYS